ncbi:MAG: hypothetical protein WCF20_12190 [Methylovirgula sp.]
MRNALILGTGALLAALVRGTVDLLSAQKHHEPEMAAAVTERIVLLLKTYEETIERLEEKMHAHD